ncbi:MAG: hypothetical protein O3C34_18900 [Proteobacteria bacterium]|nr:hypothetical protein [Pseudomonadota bacterium]
MGIVIELSNLNQALPLRGLTRQERADVMSVADTLIEQGRATGHAIHHDSQYMCVFDVHGEPYLIGRQNGVCYLLDKYNMILARSLSFEIVLDALEMMLSPSPDETL